MRLLPTLRMALFDPERPFLPAQLESARFDVTPEVRRIVESDEEHALEKQILHDIAPERPPEKRDCLASGDNAGGIARGRPDLHHVIGAIG